MEKMKKDLLFFILGVVCLCVTTIMITKGAIAYFSDTVSADATLTSGRVSIELWESALVRDAFGNLVKDPNGQHIKGGETTVVRNFGSIFPGLQIDRDPTVKNTGLNDAWIAIKVTISDGEGDISQVIGYEGYHAIDIETLLSGGLLDEDVRVGTWNGFEDVCYNDRYAMVQIDDFSREDYEFYFFILAKQAPGDTVTVFERIFFLSEWNNYEMRQFAGLEIKVQAFGVQTSSFDSCYEAMIGAFPDYFPNNN